MCPANSFCGFEYGLAALVVLVAAAVVAFVAAGFGRRLLATGSFGMFVGTIVGFAVMTSVST